MWKTLLCASFFIFTLSLTGQSVPVEIEKILQEELKLDPQEIDRLSLRETRTSTLTGVQHFYFEEQVRGLTVVGSLLSLHVQADGNLLFWNDERLLKSETDSSGSLLKSTDNKRVTLIDLALENYLNASSDGLKLYHQRDVWWLAEDLVPAYEYLFENREELHHLVLAAANNQVLYQRLLTKNCQLHSVAGNSNRKVEINSVSHSCTPEVHSMLSFMGQYNFFPPEVASPVYGNRMLLPGASLVDPGAAPHGWHDADGNAATVEYNYTQGNHVYAYYAPAGTINNPLPAQIIRDPITGAYISGNVPVPPANSLNFNYTSDLTDDDPRSYLEDAITNLFVWNNLAHDYLYPHGFDEGEGNFQALDFSGGSSGGDHVWARAQDGTGINQASFSTPPDGSSPTMRMFLWDRNQTGDFRDASFDNVVIVHEYAHGLSLRLVGGPGNVSCLNVFEQGGEGWSDFIGMLLTLKDIDNSGTVEEFSLGEGVRSLGNYVLEQGPGGSGLRGRFYSTDMDCPSSFCNDMTYAQLSHLQAPHGVGLLWGTMLWDMCWALINKYGFEPDLSQSTSTAGNIRALRIVIEALKMTACEPTFLNMRDAVFAANQSLYGSTDEDLLWSVFARRGLGVGAQAGGGASFETPTLRITKTVDKEDADIGDILAYTLTVKNNTDQTLTNVSITDKLQPGLTVQPGQISNGGIRIGNNISWPAITLSSGASVQRTFSGEITATEGSTATFSDPVEGLSTAFVPLGQWILDNGQTNPASGSTSAWFHPSLPLLGESSLVLNLDITTPADHLVFWQWHDVESGIDGGVIEIRNGSNWIDLGSKIKEYPYTGFMYDALPNPLGPPIPFSTLSGRSGYTGYSGGWRRTTIDLSNYTGSQQIRFRYAADESTATTECDGPGGACAGWYLDDFFLLDIHAIPNEACVTSSQGFGSCDDLGEIGTIYYGTSIVPVEWLRVEADGQADHILVSWETREDGNNRGFWLERRAATGADFSTLSWIPAHGLAAGQRGVYEFVDKEVRPGVTYYYRLRQEDFDEQWSYSPIVDARLSAAENHAFLLSPNPGTSELKIQFTQPLDADTELLVFDALGRIRYQSSAESIASINTENWPAASYFVVLKLSGEIWKKRWIKIK